MTTSGGSSSRGVPRTTGASAAAGGPVKVVRRRRKTAAPDIPLGSLSQPLGAVAGPPACPECRSESLTRLMVANPVGVPAVFVSCHDCERSGWFAVDGGHEVTRESVVTKPTDEPDAEPVVTPTT